MSDYNEQYDDYEYSSPLGIVRMALNWIGALASIGLLIGLIYWVFQLSIRDPNAVPIIRAMEGPSRAQPENPGGKQVDHQGLAVNVVQSDGNVQKPAETVVLAPDPQSLAQEDVTQSELNQIKPNLIPKTVDAPNPEAEIQQAILEDLEHQNTPQFLTESTEETIGHTQTLAPQPGLQTETAQGVTPQSPFAPVQSHLPRKRPKHLRQTFENIAAVAADPKPISEVQPGTRLIQLGAYDTQERAAKEWKLLAGKHSDLLGDKQHIIQTAQSGNRKFYRLRAMGFQAIDDARNLCSALLARGTPCIPVTAR